MVENGRRGKKIKICGLTRKEDILSVNELLPDYVGFVFAPGKRQINAEKARELKSLLSLKIQAAGVFVNSPVKEVAALAARQIIDLIQLHGDEDKEYISQLNHSLSDAGIIRRIPIVKAVRMVSIDSIAEAQALPVDFLLLDSYGRDAYGGTGKSFDWTIIPPLKKPWFLAGGIGIHNVEEALKTDAFCLDASSSVETDGKKDREKIKELISKVRRTQ